MNMKKTEGAGAGQAKAGDTVRLKSGGPTMTVRLIDPEGYVHVNWVECLETIVTGTWGDKSRACVHNRYGSPRTASFGREMLEKVEIDPTFTVRVLSS